MCKRAKRLAISRGLLAGVIGRVAEHRGIESVGFILGECRGEEAVASAVMHVENAARSPVEFNVRPEDLYRVFKEAEARGQEVIAVYHSHPVPPYPSRRDVEGMELWPVVWLIVSMDSLESRAYVLRDGRITEVELVVR